MKQEHTPLEEMTLRDLRRRASELGISRYSRMRKSYLVTAIRAAELQTTYSHYSPMMQEAQTTVDTPKEKELPTSQVLSEPTQRATAVATALRDVDQGLPDLPGGYGETRIVLMPRDPQWGYTYWDIPNEVREERRK
ncbi:MAG: Rho termination factor N-terminal domain-containing protein, partial [Gloeomargarita sp. DG_2_bins_126]